MGISDRIESFIIELMKDEAEYAEFGRNELAQIFGCVPSQINYVISTRFNPEKGYTVESQRGGGG
ncbi:MAG: CtsR family transcriptional regulator, partial [Clostridia bacterium]|nr:CtsR family transcriptional regulator [Clostridia bacterium]